ncbi:glycosyl transferase [Streptococcus cuniculi]|uniref:Glycosyl transferase n=2 Tax=Streptococcus cuniculi TaxID=1432788 RepID=A0A1Q8EB69_9STRE|nr:glycosyl transferase [Streptococcus cuniculi]
MAWDKHTFVICAYGDSPYLEECIQSLIHQSLQTNIILYTSTPSSNIEKLCRQYQISCYTGQGGGIGKDWNSALSFVKTDYATIAHQDDYYHKDYAKYIFESSQKYKDSLLLYSDYFEEKADKKIARTLNLKIKNLMLKTLSIFPSSPFWRKRVLAFGNAICCPAVTYHLTKLKDFRFDETLKGNLDWVAWYKIADYKGYFTFVDKELMCHRIHEGSETSKTIEDNTRTTEDFETLCLFWPTWFAKFLMKFYIKSQKTNYQ